MSVEPVDKKTNTTAIVALAAAGLGYTCFWGVGGALAVVLGLLALREVERSEGRERGKALSITAITLGGLNVATLVLAIGVAIAMMARPEPAAPPTPPFAYRPPPPSPYRAPAPVAPSPSPPPSTGSPGASASSGPLETVLGRVRLIDAAVASGSLTKLLETQRREAARSGEKLLVFVVSPECEPCNGVSTAIPDRRMQKALDHVRVVRVDAPTHAAELLRLGVPVEAVPGFALLSETLRPVDYVHGGEWDADIPENIAPVLGAFVRGKYARRRHPFRGPTRPDETAL